MTFTPDAQVAAVLAAAIEQNGPPPALPAGDVASRRVALDAMLGYFSNEAQPPASKVDIADHSVVTPDGAALLAWWYRQPSGDRMERSAGSGARAPHDRPVRRAGTAQGRGQPAAGVHRGGAAGHLPRRGHRLRAHSQPGGRAGRTAPAPRRAARVRRHRLRCRRVAPRKPTATAYCGACDAS